ncbi:MAG TPA: class I SAM-dependent RNA methyltransferase [Gemmatimonadaceae bacterium]
MSPPDTFEAFAIAAPGLEPLVASELKSLRARQLRSIEGGVEFQADQHLLYTANLHLRTASRVIVRLARFRAISFAELERRATRVPWERIVPPNGRVRLRVTCRKSRLYHSGAVAQRLLESINQRTGATALDTTPGPGGAPEDDASGAQLFVIRVDHDQVTVSADTSGDHLHLRGYRTAVIQAPLRENLAAAMLLASGWDRDTPLMDPFCGSGTIAIEAALMARQMAPGRNRRFRFMEWPDFDADLWTNVHTRAIEAERPRTAAPIIASDRSGWAMRAAAGNAERAGVAADLQLERAEVSALQPTGQPGWLVTNPPYGVRLGQRDELRGLYAEFGAVLRERFRGWRVAILSTDRRLDAQLRLPLLDALQTTNGGIRVHLLTGVVGAALTPPRGLRRVDGMRE